jgi:uncharacterized protein YoxC
MALAENESTAEFDLNPPSLILMNFCSNLNYHGNGNKIEGNGDFSNVPHHVIDAIIDLIEDMGEYHKRTQAVKNLDETKKGLSNALNKAINAVDKLIEDVKKLPETTEGKADSLEVLDKAIGTIGKSKEGLNEMLEKADVKGDTIDTIAQRFIDNVNTSYIMSIPGEIKKKMGLTNTSILELFNLNDKLTDNDLIKAFIILNFDPKYYARLIPTIALPPGEFERPELIVENVNRVLDSLDEIINKVKIKDPNGAISYKPPSVIDIAIELNAHTNKIKDDILGELAYIVNRFYPETSDVAKTAEPLLKRLPDNLNILGGTTEEKKKYGKALPVVKFLWVFDDLARIRELAMKIDNDQKRMLLDTERVAYWRYFRDEDPDIIEVHTGDLKFENFFIPYISEVFPNMYIAADILYPLETGSSTGGQGKEANNGNGETNGKKEEEKDINYKERRVLGRYAGFFGVDRLRGSVIYYENPVTDDEYGGKYKGIGLGYRPKLVNYVNAWVDAYYAPHNKWLLTAEATLAIPKTKDLVLYGSYEHYTKNEWDDGEIGLRWRIDEMNYLYAGVRNRRADTVIIVGISGFEAKDLKDAVSGLLGEKKAEKENDENGSSEQPDT